MNEGENTGMPTAPNFSSSNTSPDNVTPIQSATPAEPGQPTAPQQSASVYSAANSLPGEDPSQPSQVISSGPAKGAGARPHFGFSRKFKDQQPQQPRQAAFSNAPDYFNQAVGDIVIADENAAAKKQKTKKIALIAVAALAVLGGALAVVLVINQINKPSANKVQLAFNRYANYILYGEEKDSDIGEYSNTTRYTIMDKFSEVDENYNKHLKELFDKFSEAYNAAVEKGIYKQDSVVGTYRGSVMAAYYSFDMDKDLAMNNIVSSLSQNGRETLVNEVNDKSAKYAENGASMLSGEWNQAMLTNIALGETYIGSGCVSGGKVNYSCASKQEAVIKERRQIAQESADIYKAHAVTVRKHCYSSLWEIKEILK